ncbi:hypothetical protein GCK72_006100 [Caenorhabditis remanei]|uniref:F-box associated domain-containing protein n=1 Tax=Caenorhabditis remanei TaxID=31234 RepID=A0A6A5HHL9_CAERE|nr:hypothetical protein GCK72_006100 [Caenorhabditis remanei]KAF1766144.1 hypothetical protein GCK72_006100 [Caenorhabditis remanei]
MTYLKKTEFRTVQSMKTVSKRVQQFITVYQKYMMPIPIRQLFITPEKVSFTLSHSNEINTINHEDIENFLRGAKVELLWLEMIGSELEPIEFLQSILKKTNFSQIACLKLGSSKMECDVAKLTDLMKSLSCTELVVDWRFRVPENFFNELSINKLTGLTIGNQESPNFYQPFKGENFRKFRGDWMELGANQLRTSDFSTLFKSWKKGEIHWISLYNIVISFPVAELLVLMKNETCQKSPTRWIISRDSDETKDELEICFLQSTNFSKHPSVVIRQFKVSEILW